MSEGSYSLNPNANSFIPYRKSHALKDMAAKHIAELYEKKKANGETTVTNKEIAELVWRFISMGYKELTDSDKLRIQNYLNTKLLSSNVPVVRPVSDLAKIRSKLSMKLSKSNRSKESFDVSKFQEPKVSFLLVAFWGLYRHEQAERPLLSLTHRPDIVKDKIWSVNASDKKLWNQSSILKVCDCPPMFGYSVPSNFFGDLSHFHYTCPVQKIHLNHYPESTDGNEFILTDNFQHCIVDEQPFEDVIINIRIRADVDDLKDQFETMISGICNLLSKFAEDSESGTEENQEDDVMHCYTSFWDDIDSKISHVPFFQQNRDSLVDDNDHPLLKMSDTSMAEEVPPEVKEMIRKSLSPKKDKTNCDINDKNEEKVAVCDPPCSVWCDSVKNNVNMNFEEVLNVHSEPTQEPDNVDDAPTINLISLDKLDSKVTTEPVNITVSPVRNLGCNKMTPSQRSFSVDGSDLFYSKTKFDFAGLTAHASNLTIQNHANFLKFYNRINSWEDTDSGFMSRSSSQEDLFEEKREHEKKNSMWEFVSGEDSLWEPLPECVGTYDKIPFSHKQIRNFRRQRSAS